MKWRRCDRREFDGVTLSTSSAWSRTQSGVKNSSVNAARPAGVDTVRSASFAASDRGTSSVPPGPVAARTSAPIRSGARVARTCAILPPMENP